jgi:hypothetical protein
MEEVLCPLLVVSVVVLTFTFSFIMHHFARSFQGHPFFFGSLQYMHSFLVWVGQQDGPRCAVLAVLHSLMVCQIPTKLTIGILKLCHTTDEFVIPCCSG